MGTPSDPLKSSTQPQPHFHITQATTDQDLAAIVDLLTAYTAWLDEDLTFQSYEAELAGLPGKYSPPTGALLIAKDSTTGEALGCIALRPLQLRDEYLDEQRRGTRFCEIKRLYTYPVARGRGVARSLIREALAAAGREGYQEVLLDTLSRMVAAIKLYKTEGFEETGPYYPSPLENVVYMAKRVA